MCSVDWCEEYDLWHALHAHSGLRHMLWVKLEQIVDYFRFHEKDHGMKVVKQRTARIEISYVFKKMEIG